MDFFQWMFDALKAAFQWVYDWITTPWDQLKMALDDIPWFADEASSLNQVVGYVDHWINVNACLSMTGIFMFFWTGLTAYKVIKSWIPTVSG